MAFIYGKNILGRMIQEMMDYNHIEFQGFLDDSIKKVQIWKGFMVYPIHKLKKADQVILAFEDNKTRKKMSRKIKAQILPIKGPRSHISSYVHIGTGTILMPGTLVNSHTEIGKQCILDDNSSVDHDCTLGDFVYIGQGSTICGNVRIGSGTFIGPACTILPDIEIGKNVIIKPGTLVNRNFPDNSIISGHPARAKKK